MKIFFTGEHYCELASAGSSTLERIKHELLTFDGVAEVFAPDMADVVLMEERGSFKDFRYVEKLAADKFISRFLPRLFTVNTDDCATGLLRGIYTSLPKSRTDYARHRVVPFMHYPNELVFSTRDQQCPPTGLASWRGNTKSNVLRRKLMSDFGHDKDFMLEETASWLNHDKAEKERYVDLILKAKFSLCPAGWAPVTYRIYESMALGRCPVILADGFVPPKGPDWKEFALFYPERKIQGLRTFLKSHEFRYRHLGEKALSAWRQFFAGDKMEKYYAISLIELIRSAPRTSRNEELRRWNSLKIFWQNHWTLPQRMLNRARKWTKTIAG